MSRSSNSADWFKTAIIKSFLTSLSCLSLARVQVFGALAGRVLHHFPIRLTVVTRKNIQICFPDKTPDERNQLVKASLIETCKLTCEMGAVWLWPASRTLSMIKNVVGEDTIHEALKHGQGLIVLGPHIGNWELFGLYLDRFNIPITFLYKAPKLAALESLAVKSRARSGSSLAPTTAKGVAILLKALNRGEIVGILPDQEPPFAAGEFAPFYGVETLTMTLVSKLLQRTGAKVVCGFAKRLDKGQGFEVNIIPASEELYCEDIRTSTAALNASVQNCVEYAPEQYQWEYKRFKKRPAGQAKVYS